MKKTLLTVYILFFCSGLEKFCFGQSHGKITYSAILEPEDYRELEGVLIYDGEKSLFFIKGGEVDSISNTDSENVYNDTSLVYSELSFRLEPPRDSLLYQVYIDRSTNQIQSKRTIYKGGSYHPSIVLEPTNSIEWMLMNESKEIGSYTVYKATSTFRGRNYTAWFTPEIDVNAGPWKFQGLPGLILEVVDDEKGVQFLFSSMKIPYDQQREIQPPKEDLVLTIDEYAAYNDPDRIAQEFLEWVSSELPLGSSVINPQSISINVNITGIEREYE